MVDSISEILDIWEISYFAHIDVNFKKRWVRFTKLPASLKGVILVNFKTCSITRVILHEYVRNSQRELLSALSVETDVYHMIM